MKFITLAFLLPLMLFAKPTYDADILESAVDNGDIKLAQEQIRRGAPLNRGIDVDDAPTSLLVMAIRKGHFEMYKFLANKGANLNGLKDGYVPIIVAIEENKNEIVQELLKRKLDINRAFTGVTPLMTAARKADPEILKAILAKKPKLEKADENGETALFYAAASGCADCVEILLKAGANKNAKNKKGEPTGHAVGEASQKLRIHQLLGN